MNSTRLFLEQLARMTTDEDLDGDMSGDDAVSALSSVIEEARGLLKAERRAATRRQSYKALQADRDRLAEQTGLLGTALTLSMSTKPDATEVARLDGDRWTFRLYGATRADGGIVIETYAVPGQRPSSSAYYLDALVSARVVYGDLSTEALRIRDAVQALETTRNTLARAGAAP